MSVQLVGVDALVQPGSTSAAPITPFGEIPVMATGQNLFHDTFDASFDTVNNWNTTTTVNNSSLTFSPGGITLASGLNSSAAVYTTTRPTFPLQEPAFIRTGISLNIPASLPTNTYAAWGPLTPSSAVSAALPLGEAACFELQASSVANAAKMFVVGYAGAVRTVIQDLSSATGNGTQPTDGITHHYGSWLSGDRMFWTIDYRVVAVQYNGVNGPNVNTQPAGLMVLTSSSAVPNSSFIMNVAAVWVAQTSITNSLSDGTFGYRKVTIKSTNAWPAVTDNALVVGQMPNTYVTVAQGLTQQSLGSSAGRSGDYLAYLMVFPNSSNSGGVTVFDSTATTVATYAGAATDVLSTLVPFRIDIGSNSVSSGWKVTTGSSVSVLAIGRFT